MRKSFVAIVGRPNVGKSTFFNKVSGQRISIVEDREGVTRDRLYHDVEWGGKSFTLIDTGGLELYNNDKMWHKIREQIETAVDIANLIVFFVDGRVGLQHDDVAVANFLRKSGKPVIVAVNKLDNNEIEKTFEFYELGFDKIVGISAEQVKGIGDLLDEINNYIPDASKKDDDESAVINIAVVGKPNVGKSATVNRILGYERVIVYDMPGTTRDSIDTAFKWHDIDFNIIDTAGMRRSGKIDESLEYYSVVRSMAAIKKCDVALIVIDATQEISEQDIRICGYVHDEMKPSIILVNKWDLVSADKKNPSTFLKDLREKIKFMDYMQVVFVSALTGQRFSKIMENVLDVYTESRKHIQTGILNEVVREAVLAHEPPFQKGKRLKVLYATQAGEAPPTFVIFTNDATLVHFSYKRYLSNELRRAFEFKGCPIQLVFRSRSEDKE